MDVLKSNESRVQNLTPLEIWGFIVGRVLVAFALGILAVRYVPQIASMIAVPALVLGAVLLLIAAKGMARKPIIKD
jgi:TctA family transporter